MTVTPEQVEMVARNVTDAFVSSMKSPRKDVGDRMTADAVAPLVYGASRELMTAVAHQVAPQEVLVDVKDALRYSTAGFSGFKVHVVLLCATNQRVWFSEHRDGAVTQLQALDVRTIGVQRKRLTLLPKLDGTTIACGSAIAEWLTNLQSGRQQPAPWLAASVAVVSPQPPMTGPPPGWHPDPYGRHQLRYWDGGRWSPHVSDGGVSALDPV